MDVLKRIGLLFLLLLLLLLAVLAYITMTHGGLLRIFSLGKSYVAGELTVEQSTGALVGPLTLSGVNLLEENGMSVSVSDVRFDWQPSELLRRTLQIDELFVQGIEVRLPPPAEEQSESRPFQLRDIALPLNVDVQDISISDVKIYPHGSDTPFVLDDITLKATGRESSLKLVELAVDGPTFTFGMDGTLESSGNWPINLNPQWTFTHGSAGVFVGAGSLIGDIDELSVVHKVTGPATVDIDVVVEDITGELSWNGEIRSNIDNLGVINPSAEGVPVGFNAQTNGKLSAYSVNGQLTSGHPVTGATSTDFQISGDLKALTITEALTTIEDSPVQLALRGTTVFNTLDSDITLSWSELQWPLQTDSNPVVLSPAGELTIQGTPERLSLAGTAEVSAADAGNINVDIDADINPDIVSLNALTATPVGSENTSVAVTGDINIKEEVVALNGQINGFMWPLVTAGQPIINIPKGTIDVNGPLDNYQLNIEMDVAGKDIPDGSWAVQGNGNRSGLDPLSLEGETLRGQVSGNGKLSWQPQTQWQFNLKTNNIDPSEKWPDLNGDINLQLSSEGSVGEDGLSSENRIVGLSGSYRQQPLQGDGVVIVEGSTIRIEQLAVQAGAAALRANGVVSDELRLEWDVDVPGLDRLVPDVAGGIKFSGTVTGPAGAPSSNFSVAGTNLDVSGTTVNTLSGSGRVDLSGGNRSSIELKLTDVVSGGQQLDTVTVNGSGTPAKHTAGIGVSADIVDVTVNADGSFNKGQWKGVIDALNIDNEQFGEWALRGPVQVEASAESVNAGNLCLESDPASVCVDGDWSSQGGADAQIAVDSLDTVRFEPFFPPDLLVDTLVSGNAIIKAPPGESPRVSADISADGGTMEYLDGGEPKSATLGKNSIQFEYRDDSINSDVDLDFGEIGTVAAKTSIAELSGAKKLGGRVKTDIKDIGPFSAFAPGLDSFDGTLATEMKLAGTLDAPTIAGGSELDAVVLEVPSVAMKLIDGKIVARGDGKGGLLLNGTAKSGDGEIRLQGRYNPALKKLDATVKGKDFRVANANRQNAVVSPDLKINMDGEDISVTGVVHIPSAYIDAGGSSSLVKESPDVVLVNDDKIEEQAPGNRLSLDVRVTLGDDIQVKAGGFSGALGGELTVEQLPDGVPTGIGTIEVESGDFLVYGQTLTMEQGRILFGGGPISNPALDFDVAREVVAYDVKAGARITGTAQAPILQLQSDPPQTDANTLSFILLGTPVGTEGLSYTLGKYITPDIYVSYERDLFTDMQTFGVRYRITDLLKLLGSRSKDVSGADLVYTFER